MIKIKVFIFNNKCFYELCCLFSSCSRNISSRTPFRQIKCLYVFSFFKASLSTSILGFSSVNCQDENQSTSLDFNFVNPISRNSKKSGNLTS